MKTTLKCRMALVVACTILLSLLPKLSAAQINPPYTIRNHTFCKVQIRWDIWDASSCSSCTQGGVTLQPSGSPGDTYVLTGADFGSCAPACNIFVYVFSIGGSTTGLPVIADMFNPTPALPVVSGCTGASPQMNWNSMACFIDP